ncbi:MAG TPA: PAS domain S-box protein [Syntrophorhabdaceae bacterium]|nr:PAS domain S-box protein [Syntrophorhabdaceae bacterium]
MNSEERRNPERKRRKSDCETIPQQQANALLEDLRIHQVELEMQNEELRRAQQELEESRTRLLDLYDFAPVAYFTINDMGLIVEVNLTALQLLEYSREAMIGSNLGTFIHRDFRNEFALYHESISNDLGVRPRDVVFMKSGGQNFWGRLECVQFHPLKQGGEPLFFCALIDITDRKQAEESLRESEEKYRILVEKSDNIIIRTDMEGRVVFINEYGRKLFGYSAEELWARGAVGTIIPEDLLRGRKPADILKEIAEHPVKYQNGETRSRLASDAEAIISWAVSPLHDENGLFQGVLAVGRDISEKLRLENELRHAQKMEAIGTLAGGIAHDFNNILAAIIGFTEMAIEDIGDNPVNKKLDNVLKSAVRARNLVKQILAFSRKADHERHLLSLSEIVRETIELLTASIPSTIKTEMLLPDKDDVVIADPIELQQILINLTTNAVWAMRDGGTLKISIAKVTLNPKSNVVPSTSLKPGEYVQLVVQDPGTGITPETMRRGFEPFFTTREVGEGTGMGLATVYGTVKGLGGDVSVESEVGKGSRFTVHLPKASFIEPNGAEDKAIKSSDHKGGTILFIDDEEMLVEWGQTTLEREGYQVETAPNGATAFDAFSRDPGRFDLVITDQAMPGTAGAELSKKLLQIRPDIPIILCTGHSETVSQESAKEMGITEFLMKPLTRSELTSAVRRVLDERKNR